MQELRKQIGIPNISVNFATQTPDFKKGVSTEVGGKLKLPSILEENVPDTIEKKWYKHKSEVQSTEQVL